MENAQHRPTCPRCGHSYTERSSSGGGWVCRHTWTENVRGRIIGVAPNMNPLAPGPHPGTPVFEWHTRTVRCGTSFTAAEAEEAARRRRREAEQREAQLKRSQETQRRIAALEGERKAALGKLPAVNKPIPVKREITAQGCGIGCGLWLALMALGLAILGLNGQLDSEDPKILGVENPLVLLPATWCIGWILAVIRFWIAKSRYWAASARAARRATKRARVKEDFDRRIADARRATQQ